MSELRFPVWARWLAAVTALRAVFAAVIPLTPEESYHWNFAVHLDWSYFDHPGVIAWSISLGRCLFGDIPFAIRFVPLLFAAGTGAVLARLARKIYGEPAAASAVLLLSIQPVTFATSAAGFPDSPALFFWALAMMFVWEALDGGRGILWIPAGLAFGLGMLSKYTVVFFGVSVLLHLLTSARHRRWLATPWPWIAALLALAVCAPIFAWNARHEWSSIHYQSSKRLMSANEFRVDAFLKFLGLQWAAVVPLTLPLAVSALRRAPRSERPAERYLFWCFAPIFVFFAGVSWTMPTHVVWPLPAWLGATVLMAGRLEESRIRVFVPGIAALTGLLFLLAGAHAAVQLPNLPQPSSLHGWDTVAERARALRADLPEGSFYLGLGRKYTVASQLAWHLKAPREVYGKTPLGESELQFDYWTDVKKLEGRDAVVVLESFAGTGELEGQLRKSFRDVEPAGELVVPLRGGKPLRFRLYRARGYIRTLLISSATPGR